MKFKSVLPAIFPLLCLGSVTSQAAVVALPNGTYTQNFNAIGSGLPAGWDVRIGSSTTSLGNTAGANYTAGATAWTDTAGAFKNFASAATGSGSSTAVQSASANRALGIRQSGSFGDAGGSFNFNFSSTSREITSITLDLQTLDAQPRNTTYSIQYGIGAAPTSFTTLGTYTTGAFGSTTRTFTETDFGTSLDNVAVGWFRVVALTASTGSGNRDSFAIDNFSIVAVPEPQAATLLGAMGVLGILRRRR